jgi:hypothetical protein
VGYHAASGLATWESHEFVRGDELLRVTAVPGHHGPRGLDRLLPPVMGSIVDLERGGQRLFRLYITGTRSTGLASRRSTTTTTR